MKKIILYTLVFLGCFAVGNYIFFGIHEAKASVDNVYNDPANFFPDINENATIDISFDVIDNTALGCVADTADNWRFSLWDVTNDLEFYNLQTADTNFPATGGIGAFVTISVIPGYNYTDQYEYRIIYNDTITDCAYEAVTAPFNIVQDEEEPPPEETATTTTATSTLVSDPNRDLFNGILLFFIPMFFIVWYFRGKVVQ